LNLLMVMATIGNTTGCSGWMPMGICLDGRSGTGLQAKRFGGIASEWESSIPIAVPMFPAKRIFKMQTIKRRLVNFRHNMVAHPIAGVLWLFGFEKAGDWVHDHI
jgi:hypothetical protein